MAEKIEACHVPQMALDNMTTEALLETVLNYPLLGNMLAYDTPQMGFEAVREYCNGLQELWSRPDAEAVVSEFVAGKTFEPEEVLHRIFSTVFLNNLQGINLISPLALNYTLVDKTTPKGSWVIFRGNITWNDFDITEEEAAINARRHEECHPFAVRIRPLNISYNCHSYTFYSTSASNNLWLEGDEAETYITDGSYVETSPAQAGDKAWYNQGHSGIVQYVQNGQVYVRSKWGIYGLYEHEVNDCPYRNNAGITFYRLWSDVL